jgi:hypothetical protein
MRTLVKIAKWIGIGLAAALIGLYFFWVYIDYQVRRQSRMIPKEDCPILALLHPIDRTPIKPDDYIELTSDSGGPYAWNPVSIRIFANGRIDRETVHTIRGVAYGCPLEEADKTLHIPATTATTLIARARDGGFCRLCGSYHYPGFVFDGGSETITLSINKKAIAVSNSEGTPPPLFLELGDAIAKLSPMGNLADPRAFAPKRATKCEAFLQNEEQELVASGRKGKP